MPKSGIDKVLVVDDEQNILDAIRGIARRYFDVDTALGASQALDMVQKTGPYAVVLSDLKMPGVGGIDFLAAVRELAPDTVRIMLTGHGDLTAAMEAVNRGEVFRFYAKPCPSHVLLDGLQAGLARYRQNIVARHRTDNFKKTIRKHLEYEDTATPDDGGANDRHIGTSRDNPIDSGRSLAPNFTAREATTAAMIRVGASTKQIAQSLNVSPRTVETYRQSIRKKLGLVGQRYHLHDRLLDRDL